MKERDEEHRPKATRNAGAFFSPTRGPTPVPMDIDRYWDRLPTKRHPSRLARNVIVVVAVFVVALVILWVSTPGAASGLPLLVL